MKRKDRNTQSPSPAERLPSLDRSSRVLSYKAMIFEVSVWYTIEYPLYQIPVKSVYVFPLAGYLNVQGITTHDPDKPTTDSFTTALHPSAFTGDTERRIIQNYYIFFLDNLVIIWNILSNLTNTNINVTSMTVHHNEVFSHCFLRRDKTCPEILTAIRFKNTFIINVMRD